MKGFALALWLTVTPPTAQEGPQPSLAGGETVEVELRADFNGDGQRDLAYIARGEDKRELRVVVSQAGEGGPDDHSAQVLALDPYPLVDGTLKRNGTVLLLDELGGGTTAVFSTHRFRWDAKLGAMRLIGLDATLYSRTFAHDGKKASWNLLTGDLHTHTMRLRKDNSDIAYEEVDKQRRKQNSPPLRLEESPDGAKLLGWPCG